MKYLYFLFIMLICSSAFAGGVLKQYDDYKPKYAYLQSDTFVCSDILDIKKIIANDRDSGYSCINTDLPAEVVIHEKFGLLAYIEIIVFITNSKEEVPPFPIAGWVKADRLNNNLSE